MSEQSHKPDHVDYSKRIVPLRRQHPDRLVGESTGNAMDFRADESLYRPSSLGRASIDAKRVVVGEDRPFELKYTAGRTLPEGAVVKFWMAGQGALGTTPQTDDPARPGYVEVETPQGLDAEVVVDGYRVLSVERGENPPGPIKPGEMTVGPVTIGFRIVKGELAEGQAVRLRVGGEGGFRWKKVAARREFKVILDLPGNVPKMRLPEPVRIEMLPRAPESLDVLLPGSARPGEPVEAQVRLRDEWDNRVERAGVVLIERDGQSFEAPMSRGLACANVGAMGEAPLCLKAAWREGGLGGVSNPCVPSADEQLLFGDWHTHDFNSTAEGWPADLYLWARDEIALDFLSVPVQVHRWIDNEKWALVKHFNEYFLDEGRFVTLLAFEYQHSSCGDKVVHFLGGDQPYLPVDLPEYDSPAKLYAALCQTDAVVISHHPGYALDLHVPGARWEAMDPSLDRLVELWSMHGSSEGYDPADRPLIPPRREGGAYEALRNGHRFGFTAGSDTHTGRPGGSVDDARPYRGGLCGLWAKGRTRRDVFQALVDRRTYALTGARIALRFSVNGTPMGSEAPFCDEADVRVEAWAPSEIETVEILRDTKVVETVRPTGHHAEVEWGEKLRAPAFYHCRVTQADGHLAVASPVWIG